MDLAELQRALLDPTAPIPSSWPAGAWGILLLFLIPVGGGIPAGVLLASQRGIGWPLMMALYFISDVILAFVFEPPLRLLIKLGRIFPAFGRIARAIRDSVRNTAAQYGNAGGPLALILVSFGVDPMTGRAAAAAAGHGFVPGWAIAVTGDMFYFALLMTTTLWLGSTIDNDRLTIGIMLVIMILLPAILRRVRSGKSTSLDAG